MNGIPSSEFNNSDRKRNFLTRSPNQYQEYDTEKEISGIDEYRACLVFFWRFVRN